MKHIFDIECPFPYMHTLSTFLDSHKPDLVFKSEPQLLSHDITLFQAPCLALSTPAPAPLYPRQLRPSSLHPCCGLLQPNLTSFLHHLFHMSNIIPGTPQLHALPPTSAIQYVSSPSPCLPWSLHLGSSLAQSTQTQPQPFQTKTSPLSQQLHVDLSSAQQVKYCQREFLQ